VVAGRRHHCVGEGCRLCVVVSHVGELAARRTNAMPARIGDALARQRNLVAAVQPQLEAPVERRLANPGGAATTATSLSRRLRGRGRRT
jgi:hypothetical protein